MKLYDLSKQVAEGKIVKFKTKDTSLAMTLTVELINNRYWFTTSGNKVFRADELNFDEALRALKRIALAGCWVITSIKERI